MYNIIKNNNSKTLSVWGLEQISRSIKISKIIFILKK